jgi:hypothetical protein
VRERLFVVNRFRQACNTATSCRGTPNLTGNITVWNFINREYIQVMHTTDISALLGKGPRQAVKLHDQP